MARTGYTLPVFAVAAAKAALLHLQSTSLNPLHTVTLDLLPDEATIPIQQVARLEQNSALAIALSDPGDNLDLTRNTPIWIWVKCLPRQSEALILEAGEGIGKTTTGDPAIYRYARRLFEANLLPLISPDQTVTVSIVMPEGRQLAQRTSNEAFGVLEGLSLLGTSGISQPLSAEDHLEELRQVLHTKVQTHSHLVFCIGSHGMHIAQRMGVPETAIVQVGNWVGALLLEAGLREAESVLLLGYQGKLVKLAGGIFNTSSHLADAKLEIIAATVVRAGGDLSAVEAVLAAKTADEAYKALVELNLADTVFSTLATTISQKAQAYVQKYGNVTLTVGTSLFDRQGQIIGQDAIAAQWMTLDNVNSG
ncbi:cobalt-precorrin-5B (C(1))-methyltransferase [Oscillatoria sp. FACHB-1407]|uniref:cobalt-precorrin-5B (C(1))-methyltransferase CbiD n=1 Tax=Oscillatoria sp. FACHB-1407 TaxID=2692847 RepID=UPI001684BDE9|nr:cobalt-precorrin-5B (C(1))-methyltransferase CbiD [Oscillatoria sp. FACHB-1407]MBD2463733.1 cobalt-precorrin-5B (C(1))-methyltransferase [Oscillatoria sp. FACHB-1407]